MPDQSVTSPSDLPLSDFPGFSYFDPYYLPHLLTPLDPSALLAAQVDLNYIKYLSSFGSGSSAVPASDQSYPQLHNPCCVGMTQPSALTSSLVATSPPLFMDNSGPSSPAPTPATIDSGSSPKHSLASDAPGLSLFAESAQIASTSVSLESFSCAPKRSLPTEADSIDNISVDDPAARKRRQNTIAARKSRLRKMVRMEELERTVASLEKDKITLETRLAVLESEKSGAVQRADDAAERIRTLEAQLLEAYKSQR